MRAGRGAWLVAACLLLAACATRAPRAPLPPEVHAAALQRQHQREAVLAASSGWALQGRVALSNGEHGGSGRIDWQQHGDTVFQIALSAPITRRSWRLHGDAGGASIEGLEGGPRNGADPAALLRETTGWEIPVAALAYWARGAAAPETTAGPAQFVFAADGRLVQLRQAGWVLDYDRWAPDPVLGIELPHRINASRPPAKVKLAVGAWETTAADPAGESTQP